MIRFASHCGFFGEVSDEQIGLMDGRLFKVDFFNQNDVEAIINGSASFEWSLRTLLFIVERNSQRRYDMLEVTPIAKEQLRKSLENKRRRQMLLADLFVRNQSSISMSWLWTKKKREIK